MDQRIPIHDPGWLNPVEYLDELPRHAHGPNDQEVSSIVSQDMDNRRFFKTLIPLRKFPPRDIQTKAFRGDLQVHQRKAFLARFRKAGGNSLQGHLAAIEPEKLVEGQSAAIGEIDHGRRVGRTPTLARGRVSEGSKG